MSFRSFLAAAVLLFGALYPLSAKPLVYVPVEPYAYLFERLAGDWADIQTIVGEGDDPHDYSPPPRQLAQMSKANLLCSGELGFEGNFFIKIGDGVSAPKPVNLLEGLPLLEGSCEICESNHAATEEEEHAEEGHEDDHHHHHDHDELKDPHVWLSPLLLKQMAPSVAVLLKEHTAPEADSDIDANLQTFLSDLDEVHQELTKTLAPMKGQTFYVYHGAFAYFADAYGLTQKAVEVSGRQPAPKELAQIAKQAKEDEVKLLFVQPQFDESSARSLASTLGGSVQTLDPLERDVIANLRSIAQAIQALGTES
ncbi:MAG: zinc ABC transporter substrate-binding protein [Verrucomicrobiota bacterium]